MNSDTQMTPGGVINGRKQRGTDEELLDEGEGGE